MRNQKLAFGPLKSSSFDLRKNWKEKKKKRKKKTGVMDQDFGTYRHIYLFYY